MPSFLPTRPPAHTLARRPAGPDRSRGGTPVRGDGAGPRRRSLVLAAAALVLVAACAPLGSEGPAVGHDERRFTEPASAEISLRTLRDATRTAHETLGRWPSRATEVTVRRLPEDLSLWTRSAGQEPCYESHVGHGDTWRLLPGDGPVRGSCADAGFDVPLDGAFTDPPGTGELLIIGGGEEPSVTLPRVARPQGDLVTVTPHSLDLLDVCVAFFVGSGSLAASAAHADEATGTPDEEAWIDRTLEVAVLLKAGAPDDLRPLVAPFLRLWTSASRGTPPDEQDLWDATGAHDELEARCAVELDA